MISLHNVSTSFSKKVILENCSTTFDKGKTTVIIGKSGAGKSVLLKHILGITKPSSGRIVCDDIDITALSHQDRYTKASNIGMLFQSGALFDSMNVWQNVAFFLHNNPDLETREQIKKDEIKKRALHALDTVGLSDAAYNMPEDLSGGMKKRVALARLICYKPSVMLFDEPTTGLDPITAMEINKLIKTTHHELKATSIVVTHDVTSAIYLADDMILIENGNVEAKEPFEAFTKNSHPTITSFFKSIHTTFEDIRNPSLG